MNGPMQGGLCFEEWLVGFTDGDGCFTISKDNSSNHWRFSFQLTQSCYNKILLDIICMRLGIGKVEVYGNEAVYRIRNRQLLLKHIVPIFVKYPLYTSKQYHFDLFHRALLNTNLCTELKAL
jgi:hypothetical protein